LQKPVGIDVEFIASLMKVKGLTESEFANKIGMSHSMVNRVLNGKRGAGSKFIFGVISAFSDVEYSQLVKHDPSLTKGNKQSKRSA